MQFLCGLVCVVGLTLCLYTDGGYGGAVNCDIDRTGLPDDTCAFDLLMKGAHPTQPDGYFCSSYNLADEIFNVDKSSVDQFIVKFEPLADAGVVHHMLIFGCQNPARNTDTWQCGSVCKGDEQIIFAWAKNAPPLAMPKDVGRHIGSAAQIDSIVVQIHYVNPIDKPDVTSGIRIYASQTRQPFLAGIYLMLAYSVKIPANKEKVHADISCRFSWKDPIVPFGFRTHAHGLGRVISGYKFSQGQYELIGKGNPQWPQAFYPVEHHVTINPGDMLAARCTYNSTGRNRETQIGATSADEMCNFYIMYYMKASSTQYTRDSSTCAGNRQPAVFAHIPADSDTPLPANAALDSIASGHHHHHAMTGEHNDEHDDDTGNSNDKDILNHSSYITPDLSVTSSTNGNGNSSLAPRRLKLNKSGDGSKIKGDSNTNSGSGNHGNTNDGNHGNINGGSGNHGNGDSGHKTVSQGRKTAASASLYNSNGLGKDYLDEKSYGDRSPYGRPEKSPYLFDYDTDYPPNDYYDVMRQRSRGRVKKPYYDLYDSPKQYGLSEFSGTRNKASKTYPSLSRNRNKDFDAKYDDYAASGKSSSKPKKGSHFTVDAPKKGSHSAVEAPKKKGSSHVPGLKATASSSVALNVSDSISANTDSAMKLNYISDVGNITIGQVGGVAVNENGELHIFHRGGVLWNALSFNYANVYQQKKYPVAVDPIIIMNADGSVKRSFGKDRFFMPHGLSLDKAGNVWVTDVALHQVFRFPKDKDEPDLTLGIEFEPGTDSKHFCKPADVVVLASGEFFVADGYCNNRIMMFDVNGYFIKQWGTHSSIIQADSYPPPGSLDVPHSLALAEDRGLLCVADRENGRIQCFDLTGKFVRQIHPSQFGEELYAIEYCPKHGGVLFAVNGPSMRPDSMPTKGFTLDINTGKLLSSWDIPKGFTHPHDLTVDTERHYVYVGELNPSKVWKFQMPQTPGSAPVTPGLPTKKVTSNTSVHADVGGDTGKLGLSSTNSIIDVVADIDVVNGTMSYAQAEGDGYAPSLIIGTLLVVPVVLLIIVTVVIRLYHTGYFQSCRRRPGGGHKSKFNLGTLLNSHKGFDRLSTEDDDHDLENAVDDSDNEEFSIVRKA